MLAHWKTPVLLRSVSNGRGVCCPDHSERILVLHILIRDARSSQILIEPSQGVLHVHTLTSSPNLNILIVMIFNPDGQLLLSINQRPSVPLAINFTLDDLWGLLPAFLALLMSLFKSSPPLVRAHAVLQSRCIKCLMELRIIDWLSLMPTSSFRFHVGQVELCIIGSIWILLVKIVNFPYEWSGSWDFQVFSSLVIQQTEDPLLPVHLFYLLLLFELSLLEHWWLPN